MEGGNNEKEKKNEMKQEQENFDGASEEIPAACSQLVRQDEEWVRTGFIRGESGKGGGWLGRWVGVAGAKGRRREGGGGLLLEFAHQKGE